MKTIQDHSRRFPDPLHQASFSRYGVFTAEDCWRNAQLKLGLLEASLQHYTAAPGLIGQAAAYQIRSGGKRWRPLFLLAAGEALGAEEDDLLKLAAATELLHNASLVHDDLQDRDAMRRGQPTIWRRFGPETAINLGDFLISGTYLALSHIKAPGNKVAQLVSHFAKATHQVIAGQSLEIETSRKFELGLENYRFIAQQKSGVLMALPVVSAMMLADAHRDATDHARKAMRWLGAAYQIKDDLDDLFGRKSGRPAGVDLREGRISLPNLLFHEMAGETERHAFEAFIGSSERPSYQRVRRWVLRLRESPAVHRCWMEFDDAVSAAARHIEALPELLGDVIERGKGMLLKSAAREEMNVQP